MNKLHIKHIRYAHESTTDTSSTKAPQRDLLGSFKLPQPPKLVSSIDRRTQLKFIQERKTNKICTYLESSETNYKEIQIYKYVPYFLK